MSALADGEDQLYVADRMDDQHFEERIFRHCTFGNVSFLDAELINCRFLDCAFLDCYFRRTKLTSSMFEGCRFEDCFFDELEFADCTFRFPQFRGCYIAYDEFRYQFPADDPRMRFRIADELAREAARGGAAADARQYRLEAANGWEGHLFRKAMASGSDYYRHFDPGPRLRAAWSW